MDRRSEDREILRDPEVMARMAATDDLFRSAIALIRERGFDRGIDLVQRFEELLVEDSEPT